MQSSVESGIPLRHVHKTAKTIRKKLGNANASFDIRSLVWDSCGGIRKRTSIWTGPLSTQAKNREDRARRSEWRSYPWLVNLCIGSCTKDWGFSTTSVTSWVLSKVFSIQVEIFGRVGHHFALTSHMHERSEDQTQRLVIQTLFPDQSCWYAHCTVFHSVRRYQNVSELIQISLIFFSCYPFRIFLAAPSSFLALCDASYSCLVRNLLSVSLEFSSGSVELSRKWLTTELSVRVFFSFECAYDNHPPPPCKSFRLHQVTFWI